MRLVPIQPPPRPHRPVAVVLTGPRLVLAGAAVEQPDHSAARAVLTAPVEQETQGVAGRYGRYARQSRYGRRRWNQPRNRPGSGLGGRRRRRYCHLT